MTQQNHSQSATQFLILPSQRILKYQSSSNKLTLHLNIKAQDYALSNNKLALILGKSVKYYNLENGFSESSLPILESYFPKKVQGITIDREGKIVVTDKFGDIYQARSQNSLFLNSNLGIPTFMKHIFNPKNNRQYIVLGDDYCKIKVYNYKNMHEITAIWYIANSIPLDILQINQNTVILLVKHQDKQNLQHTYKLYQFNINDLDEGDFKGALVYSDKTQTLNNSQYHPCSVTYCQKTQNLFFFKLYDHQLQIVSFSFNSQSNQNKIQFLNQIKLKLPHPVKDANSVQGFTLQQQNQSFLLLSYGKYYNADSQNKVQQKQVNLNQFQKTEQNNVQVFKITDNQFLFKYKLN